MQTSSRPRLASRAYVAAVVVLMLVLGAELVLSARQLTQTADEPIHLFAGYQYWRHSDFSVNPEHPPLVKLAAALPLLSLNLKDQGIVRGWDNDVSEFLYRNNAPVGTIFFRARMGASVFTYLLAALVFLWAYEMLGRTPALIALGLFVFEPNILAHGALVTTDAAVACFLFASAYSFWRYLKKPTAARLLVCGLAAGLALAAKHNGALVAPMLAVLALMEIFRRTDGQPMWRKAARLALAFVVIAAAGWGILWSLYSFRYEARPPSAPTQIAFEQDQFVRAQADTKTGRIVSDLARSRALPQSYLLGTANVLSAVGGRPMFLLGTVYPAGRWFYFPVVLSIKTTLAVLALLIAAVFVVRQQRDLRFLLAPVAIYLAASILSRLDLGVRHILPVFPFLILIAAGAAGVLLTRTRAARYATAGLLLAHAASSLHAFPNYLPYANEAAGGPSNTYRLLSDSNQDWGQGLTQAVDYLAEHHVTDCRASIRISYLDPAAYDFPCEPVGTTPAVNGTLLLSAHLATGRESGPGELNPYRQFFDREPDGIIANSILVYNGSFDVSQLAALNHARRAFQLAFSGRPAEALPDAEAAADLAPQLAETQATLCLTLRQLGRDDEALPRCERALSIAERVHPEYQFAHIQAIRVASEWLQDSR